MAAKKDEPQALRGAANSIYAVADVAYGADTDGLLPAVAPEHVDALVAQGCVIVRARAHDAPAKDESA